ncbi:tryptophan transporter [Clostridium magnum]|uniref:Putative tryptophan transport protein n=1 Tax=Clostridium magnum DSM 2767 TaxID=1121326 RepID=A0A162T0P5_9CLOT|nr:tryptophan transporter [Clostridium magnum]KZL92097.1 putative tryptophan transport protein [Clostridium magnum DSM 2767]SHH22565.1 Tryptophan transporter TrpP [Clostridium magnum DSM 2767]
MSIKKIIINSLFLGIGAVLHQITPPILLGMKPDFSLAMLFIIMVLNEDYKTCLTSGIVAGILAAATTTFPGGQLANIVDKLITTNIMFLVLMPLRSAFNNQIKVIIASVFGTLVSGTAFLTVALITVGLPANFRVLFLSVVLPACLINGIAGTVLFNALNVALKRGAIKGI